MTQPLSLRDDEVLGECIDKIAGQIQAGETVDLEAFLRDYPGQAEELKELLPAIHILADLGQSVPKEERAAASGLTKGLDSGSFGDFRILREAGRGGMGVVYEAEQISLGRRVALKVLPFAATMDPRHLQRFRNEALAAAHLHHNHIVPVFGVGCERGVHYYAMQFIEGQTLAEVIADLGRQTRNKKPDPPAPKDQERPGETKRSAISTLDYPIQNPDYFRKVAQLGIQAAEALDYAHQMGVIHRDIKPGNLILDSAGTLWITDFGLASYQGNDAGLTRTGDLLGTIRYMSPEQASPKRLPIDQRSDIYSLGTTLYELLTLEPAFPDQDPAEVLVQLAFQEPRSPRSLNPAVPAELETIVLKAMAKNREGRYAVAQELTDDLRRFLEDQPIKARRPTLAQRWLKWTRRHRALVRTVAAAAVITLAALILALFSIWNEKNKTLAAYQEKEKAFRAEQQQRRNSEQNVRLAMQTLDQIYLGVAERWSLRDSQPEPRDRELLEKALVFYELFSQKNADNVEARKETARAYLRVGDVGTMLGQQAKALDAYRQAVNRFQSLVADFPKEPVCRQDLGRSLYNLASVLENSRHLAQAVRRQQQAISHRQWLTKTYPESRVYRQELADSYHRLATLFASGDQLKQADAAFAEALSLQKKLVANFPEETDYQVGLAAMQRDMGHMLWKNGRLTEAEGIFQDAQALLVPLIVSRRDAKYQARLATLQDDFGTLFHEMGKGSKASAAFRGAIKAWKELAHEFPNVPGFQLELAASQNHLGRLLRDSDRNSEANETCGRARNILERLSAKFPGQPKIRDVLGDTLNNLGVLLAETSRFNEGEKLLRRSLSLRQDLVSDYPDVPEYRRGLACAHHHLGILLRFKRQTADAEKALGEALAILSQLVDDFPRGSAYRFRLAMVAKDLGNLLIASRRFQEAETALRTGVGHLEKLLADSPHMPSFRRTQGVIFRNLGDVLAALAKPAQAEKAYRQALAVSPNDPITLNDLAWLLATGPDPQLRNPKEAVDLVTSALRINPKATYRWNTLGVAHFRAGNWQQARMALKKSIQLGSGGTACDWLFLSMTCWQIGDKSEARRWFKQADDWMNANPRQDEELRRFHKEAAELLGL